MTTDPQAERLHRLRWSVAHAVEHVPHFRALAAGRDWSDLGSVAELAEFPLSSSADLRAAGPLAMSAVPRTELVRVFASRGGFLSGETHNDALASAEILASGLRAMGLLAGDLVVILTGGHGIDGVAWHRAVVRTGSVPLMVAENDAPDRIAVVNARGIVATPSQMIALSERVQDNPLDIAMLCGEPMSDDRLTWIERHFDLRAADIYGLTECGGAGVAMGVGPLTVTPGHVFAEILDPVSGAPCAPGEIGELVVTTLSAEAFPIIRFRTGDFTRFHGEPDAPEQVIERVHGLD